MSYFHLQRLYVNMPFLAVDGNVYRITAVRNNVEIAPEDPTIENPLTSIWDNFAGWVLRADFDPRRLNIEHRAQALEYARVEAEADYGTARLLRGDAVRIEDVLEAHDALRRLQLRLVAHESHLNGFNEGYDAGFASAQETYC